MGNEGGSIPRRNDLVKLKKIKKKMKTMSMTSAKAYYCSISKEHLKPPVMCCRLGYMYNKDVIITSLVSKKIPMAFLHVKSLKDVREIKPEFQYNALGQRVITCPFTRIEFNGLNKFYALWSCGCVFSEKALLELGSTSKNCLNCNRLYKASDLINLNMTNEERQVLQKKLIAEKEQPKKEENKCISVNLNINEKSSPLILGKRIHPEKTEEESKEFLTSQTNSGDQVIKSITDNLTRLDHSDIFNELFSEKAGVMNYENDYLTRSARRGIR